MADQTPFHDPNIDGTEMERKRNRSSIAESHAQSKLQIKPMSQRSKRIKKRSAIGPKAIQQIRNEPWKARKPFETHSICTQNAHRPSRTEREKEGKNRERKTTIAFTS